MRTAFASLFLALALWRAAVDWQATLGQGYAYRFGSLGGLVDDRWPGATGRLAGTVQAWGPGWAWDPVGAFVLSLPLAPLLATIAAAFWFTRARPGRRARARW